MPQRAFLLWLTGTLACSAATEPPAVATVSIGPVTPVLASGGTVQLQAEALSTNGKTLTGKPVLWASSNSQIASVTQAGLVTAGNILGGNPENVIISATIDGVSGSLTMAIQPVPVASITLSSAKMTVAQTDTVRIQAQIKGASGESLTGRVVEWSVEDPSFAAVSSSGLVTAKKSAGDFVVRASVGSISGTVRLTAACFVRTVPIGVAIAGAVDNTDCPRPLLPGYYSDFLRFTLSQSGFVRHTTTIAAGVLATLGASTVQDSSARHWAYDLVTIGSGNPTEAALYGRGTFRMDLRNEVQETTIPYSYRVDTAASTVSTCVEHFVVVGAGVQVDRNLNTCQIENRYHHYYTFLLFAGQTITLDAKSFDYNIDPLMCIGYSLAVDWITCNDDILPLRDARIVLAIQNTGWYDFVVTTSAANNTRGIYQLTATSSPASIMSNVFTVPARAHRAVQAKDRSIPQIKTAY